MSRPLTQWNQVVKKCQTPMGIEPKISDCGNDNDIKLTDVFVCNLYV